MENNILSNFFGSERRWVNYKIVNREGKKTKIPLNPLTQRNASSTDEKDWSTYDVAFSVSEKVGIVFTSKKTLLGIDIDHCLKDGEISHEQGELIENLIKEANSYTEISPSGDGLHIFLALTEPLELVANRKSPFECYTVGRYFTVTNNAFKEVRQIRTVTIAEAVEILQGIGYPWQKEVPATFKEQGEVPTKTVPQKELSDKQLLQKIFNSKLGRKIKSLYNGDISDYKNDDSVADLVLCSHLAFWSGKNAVQIERIWLSSPLGQRVKTQDRKDYRARTIAKAIEECSDSYKMSTKKTEEEDASMQSAVKYKTSVVTDNDLYEIVYDKVKHITSFIHVNKNGEIKVGVDKISVSGEKYLPLPASHDFITKRVVLFPSCAKEFNSEKELLEKIRFFIHKYVDISETYEQIASYYVLFSWLYDRFYEVPYLRALGDFGSGKSRFLQTVGSICYKPIFTGGATTTSPLFRIIDEMNGTLVLDEADFSKSDMSAEIIKILNTGYQKGVGVMRSEGKGTFQVKVYNVYGPKIIATRETFGDKALESRCLVEEMGKSSIRADIPLNTHKNFQEEALELRDQLLMWRLTNYFKDFEISEEIISGIHPRLNQIVLPLFSIIKDDAVKRNLIEFIKKYNENLIDDRSLSREADIVFHILKLQYEKFNVHELTMKEVADSLNKENDSLDDRITSRKIGWYLRSKLQLKTVRGRRGFVLNLKRSADRLLFWKERFGITDADIRGDDLDMDDVAEKIAEINSNILY
jgi:hypothetical protein